MTFGLKNGLTPKQFLMNVLNGMAIGIVVGLIPNAAIGGILKAFSASSELIQQWAWISVTIQ